MSVNKFSFHKLLCVHIISNENIEKVPTDIYIYPHHFSIALLQWQRLQTMKLYFTKPPPSSDAKEIQGNNTGSQSLYDSSNTVAYYHNMARGEYKHLSRTKLSDNKYKKQYIKSPLVLPHEVETYIKTCRLNDSSKSENTNNEDEQTKIQGTEQYMYQTKFE